MSNRTSYLVKGIVVILVFVYLLGSLLVALNSVKANPGNIAVISPATLEVNQGDEFDIAIHLTTEERTSTFGIVLNWSGTGMIQCTGIDEGTFYSNHGNTLIVGKEEYDAYSGFAKDKPITITLLNQVAPPSNGEVFIFRFKAGAGGSVDIKFTEAYLYITPSPNVQPTKLKVETQNGKVTVKGSSGTNSDLIIEKVSPEWVEQDKTYKVNYEVKNKGAVATSDFTVALYVDEKTDAVITETVDKLAAGATYKGRFNDYKIELSDGVDKLKLCADSKEKVLEDDETNNCREENWPGIDLIVSAISIDWIEQGKTYEVAYIIKNIGGKQAEDTITTITINGKDKFESCPSINAGQEYQGKYGPVTIGSSGLDVIKICADGMSKLEESNENNNCTQKKWPESSTEPSVPPVASSKPDLTVKEYGKSWKEQGKTYVVTYTIKNEGEADAGAFSIKLYVDDSNESVATESITGLKKSETYEGNFKEKILTLSGVEDKLKLCVDDEKKVSESKEDNNCVEFTISSLEKSPVQSFPQVPKTRPPTPGITISWEYVWGMIGLVFLVGLLGFVIGRRS